MKGRLWLVRHGATDWSAAGRLTGWTDVPLNRLGELQAASLKPHLQATSFAGVWTSDLARASETARLSAGSAVSDARLRELNFGEIDGRTWSELPQRLRNELLAFERFSAPGGESVAALQRRVADFLADLPAGEHVIFTHGGVIRLLLRLAGRDAHIAHGQLITSDLLDLPAPQPLEPGAAGRRER